LAQKLRDRGYQAWALQGGYDAWEDSDLPLEQKSKAA
jgi:rhodanese-related sulfurtransferase